MADTTSTTVAARILSEYLAAGVLPAAKTKAVIANFVNFYSIEGQPADNLKLNQYTRLTAAREVAEATDIAAGTSITMGFETAQSITPAENAVNYAVIGDKAVMKAFPGMGRAAEILAQLSDADKAAFFTVEAQRLMNTVIEKVEIDLATLLTTFSDSVGTTTVDMSALVFEEGLFTLEENEPYHEDFVACLAGRQISDLRREMSLTSGGFAGMAHRNINQEHRDESTGYKFDILGVQCHKIAPSAVQTANSDADVVGGIFLRGSGAPETDGSGQPGALALVEGARPYFEADRDPSARQTELLVNYDYEAAARGAVEGWGVKIVTDA